MGCVSASAARIGGLSARAARVGGAPAPGCLPLGGARPSASRSGGVLRVNAGLVCTAGHAAYLNLEPEYLWLSGSNNFSGDVLVWSNVTWSVG